MRRLEGDLDISYRSGEDSLLEDFYIPCLKETTLYQRAVGYFTSNGLARAAAGVAHLIKTGGRIELVSSPQLKPEDIEAIARGYEEREVIHKAIEQSFAEIENELARDRLNALAWLISSDQMDVKLALRTREDGSIARGIYHEKFGIFTDDAGNQVAFSGSSNETEGGLVDNFESIDVYWSWNDPHGRVERKRNEFQKLWKSPVSGLRVIEFTEATEELLSRFKRSYPPKLPDVSIPVEEGTSKFDTSSKKWRHQDEAIEAFLKCKRGVLDMATGTGKTRTALRICMRLLQDDEIGTIIVSTDGNDLMDQWYGDLLDFIDDIEQPMTIVRHYGGHHERDRFVLRPQNKILLISRPQLAPALKSLSKQGTARTILIHDEVHRLGSPGNRRNLKGLADGIPFRLGLSATWEREYDDEGNDFIENHIGPVIFEFGLGDAIRRGILAPFNYYPLEYHPSEEDGQKIQQVWKTVAARKHAGDPMSQEEIWIHLARVHKTSRAKIPVFKSFIEQHLELLKRCIIFVETIEYGRGILELVHRYRPDFHSYFGGEDAEVLNRFARGDIECLLTCHRLSEGISIKSLNTVILFSSARAQLETIQRIGRCLRSDPANPEKLAHVVDFIRISDNEGESGANPDEARREFLESLSQIRPEN